MKLEPRPEANVVLVGYVVDPATKTGVEGANVNVWDQDSGDWGSAVTDATGSYKLLVRPGHFTINAYAPGHLNGAKTFVIAAGETAKRVDIETPAGESHYAPCDDADCRGYPSPVAYSMDASKASAPAPAAGAPGGTAQSSSSGGSTAAPQTLTGESGPAGPNSTRAAAFSGSGGGRPAYDASHADTVPTGAGAVGGTGASPAKPVSAVGILVVLGIVGGIAFAARRRA